MALNSDIAYKFGCGRYIQGAKAIEENLATELARFGKKALFICGTNGFSAAGDMIKSALGSAQTEYEIKIFESTPCPENAKEYEKYALDGGFDMICGVGGGVLMDMTKLVAEYADLPLIQIPTSSATCAAVTPLSVMYDRDTHAHLGSLKLMKEASAVIVDLDIMIAQPANLYWAGIMDSTAKLIEIDHRLYGKTENEIPLGLETAHVISKSVYDFYIEKEEKLADALKKGEITTEFDRSIFYAIGVTGIISGISKGSNQCALAHKFYEETRTYFYEEARDFVHGELVAMGLIPQLAYIGGDHAAMTERLRGMGLPVCLSDINIPVTKKTLDIFTDEMCASSAIRDTSDESKKKICAALMTIYK